MDGIRPDTERRYRTREYCTEEEIYDIGEDSGNIMTKVKIAFPQSQIIRQSNIEIINTLCIPLQVAELGFELRTYG